MRRSVRNSQDTPRTPHIQSHELGAHLFLPVPTAPPRRPQTRCELSEVQRARFAVMMIQITFQSGMRPFGLLATGTLTVNADNWGK